MIDTHSHIYSTEFDDDRGAMIDRAKARGVDAIYMPNIDGESVESMLALERDFPGYCIPMMGLHPTSVKENYREELAVVEQWLRKRNFIAIGEIGIDLYWDKTFINEQIEVFEAQLALAQELNLPVVIHSRDSFNEIYASLDKMMDKPLRGIFHSFTGTAEDVKRIDEYGTFMFGINGIVTFKNSSILEAVKLIPTHKVVSETDAPYLAPVPYRGKRNEPAYVHNILLKLAEVYGLEYDEIQRITVDNARRIFN